jgi:hypothetical protein
VDEYPKVFALPVHVTLQSPRICELFVTPLVLRSNSITNLRYNETTFPSVLLLVKTADVLYLDWLTKNRLFVPLVVLGYSFGLMVWILMLK